MNKIILASSSIYRQELLKRLPINFSSISPNIDETRINGENFEDLARRLSNEKAEAISIKNPSAFVIGSDQTAELNKREVRKPLSIERAFIQLNELSGQTLNFFSGVCLKNAQKNISVDEVVKFSVTYKKLSEKQIKSYLEMEDPSHCVGSIKSEGLGITLLEEIQCNDPSAVNNFLLEADKKKLKKIKNFIVENPKTARKALKKLNLDESLQDLNIMEHSKKSSFKSVEDYLKPVFNGESLGLLSDSGTPCIADPGAKIVSKAHEFNIKVIPLVGPSSIILSLMASGFNGQNFCFHGYVPIEENKKTNFFKEIQINIKKKQETQIFIETPYRNNKLLTDIMKIDNDSLKLCVATNLTDTNQTITSKTIKQWHQNKIPDLSKKLCIFLLN